ncbi:hypothetical protein NMY22_g5903 [Coprinellus aureogranulatus]|nr:hypothetical protein NMY22_g5903 [Coprinellus aureogranulatus]
MHEHSQNMRNLRVSSPRPCLLSSQPSVLRTLASRNELKVASIHLAILKNRQTITHHAYVIPVQQCLGKFGSLPSLGGVLTASVEKGWCQGPYRTRGVKPNRIRTIPSRPRGPCLYHQMNISIDVLLTEVLAMQERERLTDEVIETQQSSTELPLAFHDHIDSGTNAPVDEFCMHRLVKIRC